VELEEDQSMTTLTKETPVRQRRVAALAKRLHLSKGAVNIVLALVAIFWLVPTISLLVISLRPESAFGESGWWTVFTAPSQLTFHNYATIFSQGFATGGVLDSLVTSLEITIPVTILVAMISSLAAYSLVFGFWRGRDMIFLVIVGLMVVPLQVALIPVVQFYRELGNLFGLNPYGTIPGVIIFHVAFGLPFGIFLMRNFLSGIPKDLLEAGRIEGAGEWKIFYRIVLPLALPAIASLAIFQFIWVWNDLLVALVFLGGNVHTPLTIFLYDQTRSLAANYWIVSTGAVVSIFVPLVVFFSFQRYFVRGVLAGAVK
jgi:alpha-glucoside transport system permease protein